MGLKKNILKGVYNYGFEKPTYIQQQAIIPFISGHDIIGQAQSGTGKTGTFLISVLNIIDEEKKYLQGVILAPTRELARQIKNVAVGISTFTKIEIREMIGGTNTKNENYDGVQLIIGTPGKIFDELKKKKILFNQLKVFVMDEADEMLNKGFMDQIREIFHWIPKKTQIGLFSATLPNGIIEFMEKNIVNNPVKILVKNEELTLDGINQFYVEVEDDKSKYDTLCDLYGTIEVSQTIIYCNTRKRVEDLAYYLNKDNYTVSCIYGEMLQEERNKIMESFRSGEIRILITTDILSRGIDVQQVSLVINYDIPREEEKYIHRIGRSGRMGRKGVAISFVTFRDLNDMHRIEKFYSTMIQPLPANINQLLC